MTKELYLKGDVVRPGRVSVPDGMTLREIIDTLGGGMLGGRKCKAIQIGGPSGGILSADELDLALDFNKLKPYGVRRGDSVITVLDETRCMVDVCARFMKHTQAEFCGKCVPCREGNKRMSELLSELENFKLDRAGMTLLTDLGEMISVTSYCALGKGAFSTLHRALALFPQEFEAHLNGHCALCEAKQEGEIVPGGIAHDRKRIVIDPNKCKGCSRCARSCHAEAISGVIKSPFVIDESKCVKCYTCMELCAFGAISEVEVDG